MASLHLIQKEGSFTRMKRLHRLAVMGGERYIKVAERSFFIRRIVPQNRIFFGLCIRSTAIQRSACFACGIKMVTT